jgi:hypothetical protein
MPCGGGDIGLNVWVEGGELLFYVERSGSLDENNQQLKLGRIRIRIDGDPFSENFRQRLSLERGRIEIDGSHGGGAVQVILWADVARPTVYVDIRCGNPRRVRAAFESWRTKDRILDERDRMACYGLWNTTPDEIPARTHADRVRVVGDAVECSHRNDSNDLLIDKMLITQHLEAERIEIPDPQRDFVFGGRLSGEGFTFTGRGAGRYCETDFESWLLGSAPREEHHLELNLEAGIFPRQDDWATRLEQHANDARARHGIAEQRSMAWWREFQLHSWIDIEPADGESGPPVAQLGRNYQLFRYAMGCNANGTFPSKFNGSLFTVDPEGEDAFRSPDFRQWGGGSLTGQNQRLLYYPLLASGDVDLMAPQFDFYLKALRGAEARTRAYWGHAGASFAEQIENFGLPCGDVYETAWGHRGVGPRPDPDRGALRNDWCSDVYDTVLEFCGMILDAHRYAGFDFVPYLPLIDSCVTFFDEHYQALELARSGNALKEGKLVFYPGSAAETYKDATNSVTTVSAPRVVLARLLSLTTPSVSTRMKQRWSHMLDRIPEIPLRVMNGDTVIAPAESWSRIQNEELPQLYPVFPWGIFGVGKPNLDLALATYRSGADNPDQYGIRGWKQTPNFAARLGLTQDASAMVLEKLRDSSRRFPTFWGPNFDWTPDFNHAGSAVSALIEMLIQTDDRRIHLFPAWPAEWNVRFRVHAPYETVIEGELIGGVISNIATTPASRARDITIHQPT